MDWTGGARRRFAPKKNNATLQRQKAYFAKARAALNAPSQRNGSRSPTGRPSASVPRSLQRRSFSRGDNDRSVESLCKSRLTTYDASIGQNRGHSVTETPHCTHHSAEAKYRSPSIISIHSRDRSDLASSSKSRLATQQQESRRPALASKDGMDQEERLLLANRRRLLAQRDWIGLAPARPIPMKFWSSHENDRIGKRRKIDKSRPKKSEPAGQRLLTPLFEERLQLQDHMMSGALLAEDFQVRVGTDAIATQTHPSRRSYNSERISMRPPSTEFESLSEESMLLGADEGNFDSFQASYGAPFPQEILTSHAQQLCDVANMRRLQDNPEGGETSNARITSCQTEGRQGQRRESELDVGEQVNNRFRPTDEQLQHPTVAVMRQTSHSTTTSGGHHNSNAFDQQKETNDYSRHQGVLAAQDDDDGEEEIWRNFMNVAQRISSNPSVMALKSSSLHVTTSESTHRPVLDRLEKSDEDAGPLISTPKGAGTQGRAVLNHDKDTELLASSGSRPFEKLPSPSTSLKQVTKLGTCTAPQKGSPQKERDENEIWREFICGSQDDSESSSQLDFKLSKERPPVDEATTLVRASSLYIVSDLGTSNKTTIGDDTLMVEESLPSTNTHKRETSSQYEIQPLKDLDSVAAQKSASTEDNDGDSIEDDETTDRVKERSHHIHAPRTTTLNPKRFLPPQKRQRHPPKRSSSFLPSRTVRNEAPRLQHSVYDLADSDGNRIAWRSGYEVQVYDVPKFQ